MILAEQTEKKSHNTSTSINKMYKSIASTWFNGSPYFLTVPGSFSGLGHTETNKMHWSNEWKSPFCSHLQDDNTRRSIYKSQLGRLTHQEDGRSHRESSWKGGVVTSGKFITATGGPTEKHEASQSMAEISPTAFTW